MTKTINKPFKPLSAATLKRRANKIRKELAEKNARFKKMNKQRRRVAIAQDALAQLLADNYLTSKTLYFAVKNTRKYSETCQVNQVLAEGEKCYVCAKGALFASKVSFTNNLKIGEVKDSYSIESSDTKDKVNDFSEEQMDMIEVAYEGWAPKGNSLNYNDENYLKSQAFGNSYKGKKKKLIAILQNIIANKGEFKP
jgi:hypothetical protein